MTAFVRFMTWASPLCKPPLQLYISPSITYDTGSDAISERSTKQQQNCIYFTLKPSVVWWLSMKLSHTQGPSVLLLHQARGVNLGHKVQATSPLHTHSCP